ncbi:MAG: hypothetical protein KBC62_00235 [Candidatus Pacebacteria bacterium]|nr:hypothetical protein [Candidatus Paceibacterota bacterium]MBP9842414.1 hypothetical protein [Candidatus Paceibacterota bacterium]
MFRKPKRPELYLYIYDTAFALLKNSKDQDLITQGCRPLYIAAKYAIHVTKTPEDSGVMAQWPVICDEGMNAVIWFNEKKDLSSAIARLKEKYPNVVVPDKVDFEIDWPFDRLNFRNQGSSIIEPVAPEVIAEEN